MCKYVYMYICNICTFVYIYLCIHICTYAFTWTQIYPEIQPHTAMYFSNFALYLFTSMFRNTYKPRNTYTYKYLYIYVYIQILVYVYINIYTYTSICLQMYRKVPVWYSQISSGFVKVLSGSVFLLLYWLDSPDVLLFWQKKRKI